MKWNWTDSKLQNSCEYVHVCIRWSDQSKSEICCWIIIQKCAHEFQKYSPCLETTFVAAIKLLEAYRSVLWNTSWKHLGSEITGEKNLRVQVLQEILSTTDLAYSRQLDFSLSKVDQIVDGWTHPSWFINTYILSSRCSLYLWSFSLHLSLKFIKMYIAWYSSGWFIQSYVCSTAALVSVSRLQGCLIYRNSYIDIYCLNLQGINSSS